MFVLHGLIQKRVACGQELIVIRPMANCRNHLKNRLENRLGQVEFKACCRRAGRMRKREPFRPTVVDRRPEFT